MPSDKRNAIIDEAHGLANRLLSLADAIQRDLTDAVVVVVPPPPPPPPPAPTRTGLYVDGAKLRNRFGDEVQLRVVELMVGNDVSNRGFVTVLRQLKAKGANGVAPLFEGANYGNVTVVKSFCDAALAEGLFVGVNGDHFTPSDAVANRARLNAPDMVRLLNGYPHVYLEIEIETDKTTSSATWAVDAIDLVKAVRAAGHTSALKVGAPQGGRMVKHPLLAGAQVLAADPLRNILFTFQAYWKSATTGWQYAEDNGFAPGAAGLKAALGACSRSGLCFIPGFDRVDDVGDTGAAEAMAEAGRLGLSYAWWVLYGDGTFPSNSLYSGWQLDTVRETDTMALVSKAFNDGTAPKVTRL